MKNPFVGLRPFESNESSIFFGRSRDIAVLENLVLSVPVLVLYAPSGTGKSSLINAGLLPAIADDPLLQPVVVDPRSSVTQTLRQALASPGQADDPPDKQGGFAEFLESYSAASNRRVVLVLDQFEERLKEGKTPTSLYAEIARLANTRSEAATVLISIREDYLGGLENLMRRVTGLLDASYRVPNLSRLELGEAVRGPLKALGGDVTVDDILVEQVLNDLEHEIYASESVDGRTSSARIQDGHIEPGYFQIVWSHLWALDGTTSERELTQETYRSEGSATGILKSFVIDTLSKLTPFEAEVLRAALRYMVLPTSAKVALTIDDLLGLLRPADFSSDGSRLLSLDDPGRNYTSRDSPDQLSAEDQEKVKTILASVFYELTRADAPLFRRVVRAGREEFELVHDLLGLILLQWRSQYDVRQSSAVQELTRDAIYDHQVRMEDAKDRPKLSHKTATQMLHAARKSLVRYQQGLTEVKTPAEAQANGENLRSAFNTITAAVRGRPRGLPPDMELAQTIASVRSDLNRLEYDHPSRDVRGIAQVHDVAFMVMDGSSLRMISYRSRTGMRGAALGVLVWAFSQLLAISGLYIAYRLILAVWQVPHVQYLELTLGVIAVVAPFLYTVMFYEGPPPSGSSWRRAVTAIRHTLWPTWPDPVAARPAWLSWLRRAGKSVIVLVWWPVHYIVLEASCFAVALLFETFGWSPTAGFNLAALIVTLVVGGFYGATMDL